MIWHLAIETSGREASIALLQGNHLVRELNLTVEQRTTASFAPAIQTLLQSIPAGDPPLGLVSVSVGPGSFTGLRIGVTAAKTLCFALKADLVAVDSLAIICQQQREAWLANPDQFPAAARRIAVCTNAYRGQLFIRTEPLDAQIDPADTATEIVDRSRWDELQAAMDIYAVGRRVAEPLGECCQPVAVLKEVNDEARTDGDAEPFVDRNPGQGHVHHEKESCKEGGIDDP